MQVTSTLSMYVEELKYIPDLSFCNHNLFSMDFRMQLFSAATKFKLPFKGPNLERIFSSGVGSSLTYLFSTKQHQI